VQEYLVDLNATAAAKRAGYNEKTAYSMGQRLLKKVEIQGVMQQAVEERQRRTEVTQDQVVDELKAVAFAQASDERDSALKYAGKLKALELLGRHLGMFTDRVEHSGETGIRIEMGNGLEELAE